MGLDITAYKRLVVVENPEIDEDGELIHWDSNWQPGASMDWSEKHFPGRGEGIDSKAVYCWEDRYGFRAGSYSGYNHWRSQLESFAKKIGKNEAFQELIDFADNEGVIGPIVSKKLANDFTENKMEALKFSKTLEDDGWFFEKYEDWELAFTMAADNGAVDFH